MTQTSTSDSASTSNAVVRRHPIRGALWGLMLAIGLAGVLIVTKAIELDLVNVIIVAVVAVVVGVLWGTLGPAKAPTGPPPTAASRIVSEASAPVDVHERPGEGDGDPRRPRTTAATPRCRRRRRTSLRAVRSPPVG